VSGDRALATEISVTIKNSDSKVVEKSLEYGRVSISKDDPAIDRLIQLAMAKFGPTNIADASDIVVKTKTVWQ
jgi:hypothetical protein